MVQSDTEPLGVVVTDEAAELVLKPAELDENDGADVAEEEEKEEKEEEEEESECVWLELELSVVWALVDCGACWQYVSAFAQLGVGHLSTEYT